MGIETIAVVGPTASGKTRRAVEIARYWNGEIISADSRQVYRGMTIGTGKDLEEYGEIKAHLLDICDAGEKFNLHRFLQAFRTAFNEIKDNGKLPVVCGGSGMYVENALNGIIMPEVERNEELRAKLEGKSLQELTAILSDMKQLHNSTDVDTVQRALRAIEIAAYYREHPDEAAETEKSSATPLDALVIGIQIDREARRKRISQRLHARLQEGMLDEVRGLLESGISPQDLIYYGLEYKYLTLHLIGELSYDRMVSELEIAIHQFAKRQMTWFRGMERRGTPIHWLPYNLATDDFLHEVESLLKNHTT